MPRLRRLHFCSIGHKDARLAPLTLDFRGGASGPDSGAVDSVLWLRNGGGKSSIINLFYSVFRTHAREFLGSSAEGKARRLEDYVKADDLAFVLSEWEVAPSNGQVGLLEPGGEVRLVGQALAWRNQRLSADLSKLRRLFFSLRSRPGLVTFDTFPVVGLGDPVESFDAFRDWLRQGSHRHHALEIVLTDSHRRWRTHLEQLGLDPELFRYQLQMNRREGAADEAFRFASAYDFIKFLLELAFETSTADQLAKNLEAQRDSLSLRPRFEAEQRFIQATLAQLRPLVELLRRRASARDDLAQTVSHIAATLGGIDRQVERLAERTRTERQREQALEHEARSARNDHDRLQRWCRGLERVALQLDEQAARGAHEEAEQLHRELARELREAQAALVLQRVRGLEAELGQLRQALQRAALELEPLRIAAEEHGAILCALLSAERERVAEGVEQLRRMVAGAKADRDAARAAGNEQHQRIGMLEGEIRQLDARLERRERARQRLLDDALIERREPAAAAHQRWCDRAAELTLRRSELQATRRARTEARAQINARSIAVHGELGRQRVELERLSGELDDALGWRDRLAAHPELSEVEGTEQVDPEAAGLEQRVRHHAEVARRAVLDSRVEGAESDRSLAAIDAAGLLPPSRDVERVVRALQERGINAHAGPAYIADNVPAAERLALLASDPARFAGAIVIDEGGLEQAAELELDELGMPVQVSLLRDLEPAATPERARVLAPDAGLYDQAAAQRRRTDLERALARRAERERRLTGREQALGALAGDLRRYVERYGRGKLDALRQRRDGALDLVRTAETEIAELEQRDRQLAAELSELEQREQMAGAELEQVSRAVERVQAFLDEHEAELEAVRARRERAVKEREQGARALERAQQDEQRADQLAASLDDRRRSLEADLAGVESERDGVAHRGEPPATAPAVTLAEARAAYDVARAQYEQRLSENRIQWEIDQKLGEVERARDELRRRAGDLDRAAIERWLDKRQLRHEIAQLEVQLQQQATAVGRAEQRHHAVRQQLDAISLRREAEDLPADRPRPESAAEARAAAAELAGEAERSLARARAAEQKRDHHREQALGAEREALAQGAARDQLRDLVVHGAEEMELPVVEAAQVPASLAELEPVIDALRQAFLQHRSALRQAERRVRARAEAVVRVANDARFSELKLQYRERLSGPVDELCERAPLLAEEVGNRLVVIEQQLAQYDEDRRVLVDELLHVADQLVTLFSRTRRASVLPDALEGWAGRPYLRIGCSFPDTTEERRARLEPLVDRLVQQASLPGGLELVCLTARELAGTRGFDVKILKPDSVLRPDPIAITAMSTFSRGQQLTAAILLYCTLVQLRAQSRGRGRGKQDAGVLILDNPIGTCSSVPLLELQRTIAAQMRVQLIYATGVEDLEALAVLPNKVRLRNTHRDRRSGDFHVTPDDDREGAVEAVRIVELRPTR